MGRITLNDKIKSAEVELLTERLKSKQEQWDEKYKYLKFTVDSESKSGTFEIGRAHV